MREHVGQGQIHRGTRGSAWSTSYPLIIELLPLHCIVLDLMSFRVEGRLSVPGCQFIKGSLLEVVFTYALSSGALRVPLHMSVSVSDCVYWFAVHVSYACYLKDAVVRRSPSDIGTLVHRRASSTA